jgi:2,3-bisphosphoglycerate-dependent phosphoglycerate mutase
MSRANVDWSENRRVADHAIELTGEGKKQARKAGEFLATYFKETLGTTHPTKVRLWHSPYLRTCQTAEGIVETCRGENGTSWFMDPDGVDPLKRPVAHARLHFLLHEQQFGIFDGLSDEERAKQYPAETVYYEKCKRFEGKVWAKFPMGESRMDVVGRVHQASGSFKRDEEKHGIKNIVIVGHGTTNRCFAMSWLHYTPEWLEKEPNPSNCSVRLLEDGEDKGYIFDGFKNPDGYKHVPNKESEE